MSRALYLFILFVQIHFSPFTHFCAGSSTPSCKWANLSLTLFIFGSVFFIVFVFFVFRCSCCYFCSTNLFNQLLCSTDQPTILFMPSQPFCTTIFFYPFSLLATFRQQPILHFVSATFCQQANNPTHFLATSLPLTIFF